MLWVLREITEDKGKLMNQLEFKANTCDRFASAGKKCVTGHIGFKL